MNVRRVLRVHAGRSIGSIREDEGAAYAGKNSQLARVARLVNAPALNASMASATQHAVLAIEAMVQQCCCHCTKSILRNEIWPHKRWDQQLNLSLADKFDAGIRQRYQPDL